MLLQQSAFTIHGSPKPLETFDGFEKYLLKFLVPPEIKSKLLSTLDALGINESTLFPELEHLANYVNLGASHFTKMTPQ